MEILREGWVGFGRQRTCLVAGEMSTVLKRQREGAESWGNAESREEKGDKGFPNALPNAEVRGSARKSGEGGVTIERQGSG